jgi:Domain of unknown function (DUF4386)
MKSLVGSDARHQRAGGLSALYLALAYLIAMPYFLLAVDYFSVTNPAEKVALLAEHQSSMSAMHLITYVIFGVVLAVLSLTLYRRMKDGAPVIMQAATVVGLIWAFVLVASGLVFNFGMETVATLYAGDPDKAMAAWQAIEPVTEGLGGAGGEILGGLWVLLVSWAALRTGGLPKVLGWLGVAIGLVGIVSVIPALRDAGMVFGMLQIVWLVWTGVVMLRTSERAVERVAQKAAVAQA